MFFLSDLVRAPWLNGVYKQMFNMYRACWYTSFSLSCSSQQFQSHITASTQA